MGRETRPFVPYRNVPQSQLDCMRWGGMCLDEKTSAYSARTARSSTVRPIPQSGREGTKGFDLSSVALGSIADQSRQTNGRGRKKARSMMSWTAVPSFDLMGHI
jgi:hypothetical protein